jgi:Tfp pilus assembly protein PilF
VNPLLARGLFAAVLAFAAASSRAGAESPEVQACLEAREGPAQLVARCTSALDDAALAQGRRAALLTQRGLARMSSGDTDHAREDFDAAIALDATSAWTYNARAVVWMQKGETDRAIADYEQAVRHKPDYAFAWANLGNARLARGDFDRAITDLDEAIRLAPARLEIPLTNRGRAWLAKGDPARAVTDFEAALQVNSRHANAISGRGAARFCAGDFAAAAADFRGERQIRKDEVSALALLISARRAGADGRAELAELRQAYGSENGLPGGLALFGGTITPEQALKAADDRNANFRRQRQCAANFQVGEWYLLQGEKSLARRHLSIARETCDPTQYEFPAAGAELSRLGPGTP